jgi:H+/Cl- antiporter ClcA
VSVATRARDDPRTTSPRPVEPALWRRRVWWVVAAWVGVMAVASVIHPSWPLRRGALFLHLGALIAGFGAVLVTDMHRVLRLIGRRRLSELLRLTSALQPLIWGGLAVLVGSGIFLHPDLSCRGRRSSWCWCSSPP